MLEIQFLEQIKNNKKVDIYFKNGVKWRGIIKNFDDKTILLDNSLGNFDGKTILLDNSLIYKSAISAIHLYEHE